MLFTLFNYYFSDFFVILNKKLKLFRLFIFYLDTQNNTSSSYFPSSKIYAEVSPPTNPLSPFNLSSSDFLSFSLSTYSATFLLLSRIFLILYRLFKNNELFVNQLKILR
jgi:hypothetical protein